MINIHKFSPLMAITMALLVLAGCAGGQRAAPVEDPNQPVDWLSVQEEYQRMQAKALADYEAQRAEIDKLSNDAEAQFNKGKELCCGNSTAEDGPNTKQATQWLCMAARRDHPDAQYEMGNIYRSDKDQIQENVIGIDPKIIRRAELPQDDFMAYFWYSQAFKFKHPNAENQANMILPRLSQQDLVKLRDYRKRYPAVPCEVNP